MLSPASYGKNWALGEKALFEQYRQLNQSGKYAEAVPIVEQWVKLCETTYGPDHPDTAASFNNLGGLYHSMGAYDKAEPFYQRSLAIKEKTLRPDYLDTALSLNNLGILYHSMGAYDKAEPLWQRSLAIREKVLGPDHPDTAASLNNLGGLYHSMGAYDKAEPLWQRSLAIREKALGPDHPHTALSLNNLGGLYESIGAYDKAELFHQRSLAIREKVLGTDHPDTAQSLNNLGGLYHSMGAYDKAEPLWQRSLAIREKVLGPDHPDTAASLNNLGMLYHVMGASDKAEPLLQRSLAIREKALGPDHPNTALSLNNLSYLHQSLGKTHEAAINAKQADRIDRSNWDKMLSFTSEKEREAASGKFRECNLVGTLSNGPLTLQKSLWSKASLLESSLEDRRAIVAAKGDAALAQQLSAAEGIKRQLRQATLEGNKVNLSAAKIQELELQLENLQKQMARKISGFGNARRSLQCSVEQVQAALTNGSVLLDFIHYSHHLGKNQGEKRYAAVLLHPGAEPTFIPLGKAETLETLIATHRKLSGTVLDKDESATSRDAALEKTSRELYNAIAAPLEKVLPPGTQELILCPDGQFHFLAFASLLDPNNQLWAEKFTLRHISTARDLLKLPKNSSALKEQEIVLLGNPDFRDSSPLRLLAQASDARAKEERERTAFNLTRGGQSEELRGLSFPPLGGTAIEVAGLNARFQQKGWKTTTLTGAKATEPGLFAAVHSPAILHLGTHGFFVDELNLGQKKQERNGMVMMGGDAMKLKATASDPMLRSGLALSGANSTLSLWQSGKVPPMEEDGVLTAAEAASLKLDDTFLVTLSACETGLGESKSGEGVLGLKRGFAVAGAENLLMTLWQISDSDTIALMAAFYARVLAGEHPARALPAVQREFLTRLRAEKGLWHAINRAAPFTLVGATALPPQK